MASSFASPLTLANSLNTKIPKLVYGTAWKKERSADLVYQALKAGFRGVDTAAQPRHYQEKLVGDGIKRAINEGIVTREELYIQTKFTPLSGQDQSNMPYKLEQSLEERIHTSIASSLSNLATDSSDESKNYIDCLVLHSPIPGPGMTENAWKIFTTYVPHKIRALGISNTSLAVLQSIYATSPIKPSVVQNRFYPDTSYEAALRKFCRQADIVFQSFWTLTGNPELRAGAPVKRLGKEFEEKGIVKDLGIDERVTGEGEVLALYCLVMGLGNVTVLDGTTRAERMNGDIQGLEKAGAWIEGQGAETWKQALAEFAEIVGDV